MALTSTIYNASVELSDIDRGVYESLELRLAMLIRAPTRWH